MASTVRTKARPTIHEFDLIRTLQRLHGRRSPSVIQGIGDDAAVITSQTGEWTVLTTDLLTEGVHFDLRTATMADIGFRAAAANLSDIAAMGGTPRHLLVALAIPRTWRMWEMYSIKSIAVVQPFNMLSQHCQPNAFRIGLYRFRALGARMA